MLFSNFLSFPLPPLPEASVALGRIRLLNQECKVKDSIFSLKTLAKQVLKSRLYQERKGLSNLQAFNPKLR